MRRTNSTNNRGTPLVNVPIQFHIGSVRLNWQIVHKDGASRFAGSCVTGVKLENISLGDGWELVRQYLSVRADEEGILAFLVAHGMFEAPKGSITTAHVKEIPLPVTIARPGEPNKPRSESKEMVWESFSVKEFAMIQDYLRRMLISGNPTLPTPWDRTDIQRYQIAFADARSGAQAHVSVSGTFPSILATVQFKLVQGARFRTCSRKDCRLPFEVTSRHARRFCTQYCAHITSLRQRRRLEGKGKKVTDRGQSGNRK